MAEQLKFLKMTIPCFLMEKKVPFLVRKLKLKPEAVIFLIEEFIINNIFTFLQQIKYMKNNSKGATTVAF